MTVGTWTTSLVLCVAILQPVGAQDQTADPESRYYDFWEGTWHQIVNGRVDTTGTVFHVRRGVHGAVFHEDWRLVIDSVTIVRATALRAWDPNAKRWMDTWVSDGGAIRSGRDGRWGTTGTSTTSSKSMEIAICPARPGFPTGGIDLTRVSERSGDGGQTWQLRFREEYQRAR